MFPLGMITGVNLNFTPNSLNWMVTALKPWLGCTMGKGNSPPARKLASLPLTAIRLGSARIWSRFLAWSALITTPILRSVRVIKTFRTSLMLTVGAVGGVVVVVEPPLVVVVVAVLWMATDPNFPGWIGPILVPRAG